jgi:hypothetical protein
MRKFLIALFLSVLLALPATTTVTPQPPKGFEGKAYEATMAMYATKGKDTEFICTAWAFMPLADGTGYGLISAGHCVTEVNADSYSVSDTIGGPQTPIVLVKALTQQGFDFSVWIMKTTKKYPTLDLGLVSNAHIGDPIINPNCALGVTKYLSLGRISGPTVPSDDTDMVSVFPVEVDGAGGSSGSPIISAKTHTVIGILVYSPPLLPLVNGLPFYVPAQVGVGVEPIDNFGAFVNAVPVPKVEPFHLPAKDRERERHPYIPGLSS